LATFVSGTLVSCGTRTKDDAPSNANISANQIGQALVAGEDTHNISFRISSVRPGTVAAEDLLSQRFTGNLVTFLDGFGYFPSPSEPTGAFFGCGGIDQETCGNGLPLGTDRYVYPTVPFPYDFSECPNTQPPEGVCANFLTMNHDLAWMRSISATTASASANLDVTLEGVEWMVGAGGNNNVTFSLQLDFATGSVTPLPGPFPGVDQLTSDCVTLLSDAGNPDFGPEICFEIDIVSQDSDCDGVDDDGDGAVDDGFVPTPTTCGVGVCAATGQWTCPTGATAPVDTCVVGPALAPDDVTCDGQDDDCNGQWDEEANNNPPAGPPCGVGACIRTGQIMCTTNINTGANPGLNNVCTPGVPAPTDLTCDGVDEDCNGTADDGLFAVPETANGADDNCNGQADECGAAASLPCGATFRTCAGNGPGTSACSGGFATGACLPSAGDLGNSAICPKFGCRGGNTNYDIDAMGTPGFGNNDNDNDGLWDCWELEGGIDADGDNVLDLTLVGADPNHANLYLEVDWLQYHMPQQGAMNLVIAAFAAAPTANPDMTTGITLRIERDEQVAPHVDAMGNAINNAITFVAGPGVPSGGCDTVAPAAGGFDFDATKAGFFGSAGERMNPLTIRAKRLVYRYAVMAHDLANNLTMTPNQAGTSGCGEPYGDDFVVSLGTGWAMHDAAGNYCPNSPMVPQACWPVEAGTLMHEMGHTLNLGHGGAINNNINCKPNYPSVMNYAYQIPGTYVPGSLNYSPGGIALVLNEAALSESAGIGAGLPPAYGSAIAYGPPLAVGGAPAAIVPWNIATGDYNPPFPALAGGPLGAGAVDWDQDGLLTAAPNTVVADVNAFGGACPPAANEMLADYNDWANLRLDFSSSIGALDGARAPLPESPHEPLANGPDADGDGIANVLDNCALVANPGQEDFDLDFVGDACPIKPIAECIDNVAPGQYVASFGYSNFKRGYVVIPRGPLNGFSPTPQERGQTEQFGYGRQRHAFSVPFTGAPLVWTLGSEQTTASEGTISCSGDEDGDMVINYDDNCPFTANTNQLDSNADGVGDACPVDELLGFEDPFLWAPIAGNAALSSNSSHVEGEASMSVGGGNFIEVTSINVTTGELQARFPDGELPTHFAFELFIPAPPPNPYWVGATQMYVTIPSAGIYHQFLSQVELTGLPLNQWVTISVPIPANVLTALTQRHPDFSFQIALNSPSNAAPFRLDWLRFTNGDEGTPPACSTSNVATNPGFESGTTGWQALGTATLGTSTSVKHSGVRGGSLSNRTQNWHGLLQPLLNKVLSGRTYQVEAWARVSSSSAPVKLTVKQTCAGGAASYVQIDTDTANNAGWKQLTGSFTVPSCTLSEISVYVEGPNSGVTLYADDLVVRRSCN
jgi:hypothetical protein